MLIGTVVGVLKQAHPLFQLQHPAHGGIDLLFGNRPLLHQLFQVVQIGAGAHFNVAAVPERQLGGLLFVGGNAVDQQLSQGIIVADDQALIVPFLFQDFLHQPGIRHRGDAVEGIERGHQKLCTGIDAGLIGREIEFPQLPLRPLHQIVVPACLRAAVACEMLDAGGQVFRLFQVVPLEALHLGRPQVTGEHGVLSAALHHPAPPGVPGIVHHGGKGDLHAACPRLPGRHPGAVLCQLRVKGAAQAQRDGIDGAVAMDHIHHKQHGDFVGVLGQVHVLHLLHLVGRGKIQHAAQSPQVRLQQAELGHGSGDFGTGVHKHAAVVLHQLADFFLQGHPG